MLGDPVPDRLFVGAHGRAELIRGGVSRRELTSGLWVRTNRGLFAWGPGEDRPSTASLRVVRAAPLIREQGAVGGWAAALAHGFVDFDGTAPDGAELPVLLCLPRAVQCLRRRDVHVFRSDLGDDEIEWKGGVPITSVVRTACDLARLARSAVEAVVALDVLMRDDPELAQRVREWLADHPRHRGVVRARRAVELARSGSASVQETRLRMMWVLEAGLPHPLLNQWLYARDGGRLLGCADLFDAQAGLVGEYDGGHHAAAGRRARDHRRREDLERAGLVVVQHTSVDLAEGRPLAVARLRRAHAVGRARDRSADGWVVGDAPSWATSAAAAATRAATTIEW